jgi:hypothetical protein
MQAAADARVQVVAPIQSIVDSMPDVSEFVPDAPNLRDLQAQLSQPADTSEQPPRQSS